MDECIDYLGDATIFSSLDAESGYNHDEISEEDLEKTAFTSYHCLFCFSEMYSPLKNAPGTFQRAIDVLLTKFKWYFALVCLDTIVVFLQTAGEHIKRVGQVMTLLQDAEVTLNLEKFKGFNTPIDYPDRVFALGGSKYRQARLTPYEDPNTP